MKDHESSLALPRKDKPQEVAENVRIELLYGYSHTRPEIHAILAEPEPLTFWQWLWYGWVELWWNVTLPALLFAISFTAFKYALFA